MDYWIILLTIILVIVTKILYNCHFKILGIFKLHNIPHIKPLPCFGNLAPVLFFKKSFPDLIKEFYNLNQEAKYVGLFDLTTPTIIIRDPELVKTIGIKSFENFPNHRAFGEPEQDPLFGYSLASLQDDEWREARNLLSPSFTSSKMKGMFKLMSECAINFAEFMSNLSHEEQSMVDLKDAVSKYTSDVIATCAFGIGVNSLKNPTNDFYKMGKKATQPTIAGFFKLFFSRSFPEIAKFLRLKFVSYEVRSFFMDLIARTIKIREEKGINRPDMLQLMMDSRGKRGEGRDISIEEMTSHAFAFFFAGFDSTSTTICFATYALATNPEIQERLQKEIDDAFEENDGELDYDAINKLEFLDAVVNETLRLYPIATGVDRTCKESFELPPAIPGNKPFKIEKGMSVWLPTYALHLDPNYFPDPNKFNPDRFLNKEVDQRVFIPFGIEPRICIGNRFALLEMKVLLAHLLARCKLMICSKTPTPMKLTQTGLVMTSEKGFWLKIETRDNPPKIKTDNANKPSDEN